jgi:GT2 family glycosyltransferase
VITFIVPSRQSQSISFIRQHKKFEEEIIAYDPSRVTMCSYFADAVRQAKNDYIVVVSPETSIFSKSNFNLIRQSAKNNIPFVFDVLDNLELSKMTSNSWVGFNRKEYRPIHDNFDSILPILRHISSSFTNIQYYKKESFKIETFEEKVIPVEGGIFKRHKNCPPQVIASYNECDIPSFISIIIPFMYNGDRFPLFEACIKNLRNLIPSNFEICVHESGKKQMLQEDFIKKYDIKYLFSKWDGVFHRGWSINVGAKHLSIGDGLVFMDGDILITQEWIRNIQNLKSPCVAWSTLKDLNKNSTEYFLSTGEIKDQNCKIRHPGPEGAAGGIGYCPRVIFEKVGGFPEIFEGTWGGEDNGFFQKLKIFGNGFQSMESTVYHMYHSHRTFRDTKRLQIWNLIKEWDINQWKENISLGWGEIDKEDGDYKIYAKSGEPLITLAMLSYKRVEMLKKALNAHLSSGVSLNLVLRVQGAEELSKRDKMEILDTAMRFNGLDIQFTTGNHGTGIPRWDILDRAKRHFNTPYIMTTDDDMFFKPGTFSRLIKEHEKRKEFGAISVTCEPNYKSHIINGNSFETRIPTEPFDENVDAMGNGTCMFKRQVFDTCEYDKEYYIGLADFDFCLQMKEQGYKLGILADPRYKALNDQSSSTSEYYKARYNKEAIENSKKRFYEKWRINV